MTENELFSLCAAVRVFLEPQWLQAHSAWGDIPKVPSTYMCRYTSIFLKILLSSKNQRCQLEAGRPPEKMLNGTQEGRFGFCTSYGAFFDHCWLRTENRIIDLTADQFGAQKIIITSVGDTRYSQNLEENDLRKDIIKLSRRPKHWLRKWYEEQNHLSIEVRC